MTPSDEPFREKDLDSQLDELARTTDQAPATLTSRAYHALAQLHAPAASAEAEAIGRVRQRLAPHLTAPALPTTPGAHTEVALDVLPSYQARRVRARSRLRLFAGGAAALLAVGFLLGGFLAVLHPGAFGLGGPPLTTAHWRAVPSPNTPLAVNALTGITVRTSTDAWAWGDANVAPTNGSGTASNPIQTPLVEHWDGHQWRIVATPQPPEGGQITSLVAVAPDDAWAVGNQLTGGPENTGSGPLLEHWDGRTWTVVPGGAINGNLSALAALSPDDIWAVGFTGDNVDPGVIGHWDGREWRSIAHPAPRGGVQFNSISAVAPDDIWAAGRVTQGVGEVFEHWDGTRWTIVPSPPPGGIGPLAPHRLLYAISAISANDVWAAGVEDPAIPFPNGALPLFEHWDGHTWSVVPSPSLTGSISDIAALGPDDVWAVGIQNFGLDSGQVGQGLIEHWDGQQWSVVANPTPQPFTQLSGIARDPTTPGKLWAVGTSGPTHDGDQLFDSRTLIETTP